MAKKSPLTVRDLRNALMRLPDDMQVIVVTAEAAGIPLALPVTDFEVVPALQTLDAPNGYDLSGKLEIGVDYNVRRVLSLRIL
jgi:hypothetical protein